MWWFGWFRHRVSKQMDVQYTSGIRRSGLPFALLWLDRYAQGPFVFAPFQWETTLHCNVVSHLLGANSKWWTIWCLSPVNERRTYFVTSSLIGWAQSQNGPWVLPISSRIAYNEYPIPTTKSREFTSESSLQGRHNGHDGVSNHQPPDCLLKRLFGRR